ncbi:hypothetical protein HY628_03070 [Candidatus Uhrbacteria bacterium]|nr:hypothetical protein [Candidatus Uhrbacteria bacterium]
MPLWQTFLRPATWFSIYPPELNLRDGVILVAMGIILLVAGIVFLSLAGRRRRSASLEAGGIRKIGNWFLVLGLFELAWTFLAFERINLFGAFFWLLIGKLLAVVWAVWIGYYWWRTMPARRAEMASQREREKYLPRRRA